MTSLNKENRTERNPLQGIKTSKVIYPILIGLGVVGYMLYEQLDVSKFRLLNFTIASVLWLLVSFIFMVIRDLGYIVRIRYLTDNRFTWRQAFRVIMLWEFTSAITPSAIGGTGVAILYVNKEGLSVGESSAVVMATSFLDEIYFIIMFPLLLLITNVNTLFSFAGGFSLNNSFFIIAVVGYSIKLIYTLILSYGLFRNPRGLKWLIMKVFRLRFLRRWKHGANEAGTDIIKSSKELKKKKFSFWIKSFLATFFSWSARYWVVNTMFLAFFIVDDHFLLFARQLVIWIMMLVSPTPGGSGFTEFVFTEYLGEFVPIVGIAAGMALLWRLITYYPYLIIGAVIFPKWLKEKFKKKKK